MMSRFKELYGFLFGFSFILNGYGLGIAGLSLGSMVFMFFSVISIIITMKKGIKYKKGKTIPFISPFILIICLFVISMVSLLNTGQYSISTMFFEFGKLLVWAVSISLSTYIFFEYRLIYKWMVKISYVAVSYLLLQYISWYGLSYRLPNIFNIPFLRPYAGGFVETGFQSANYAYFRPSSLFSEPSFFSTFILCALAMTLFDNKNNLNKRKYIFTCLFFSIGILLGTSTSGLYLLVLMWSYYLSKNFNLSKAIIMIILITNMFVIYGMTNIKTDDVFKDLGMFGSTIRYTIEKPLNYENSARIGKSYDFLDQLTNTDLIIGVGVGNEQVYLGQETYMNSFTRLIFWSGYLGIIAFTIFFFSMFTGKKDQLSFILLVIYGIKLFSSAMMFNIFSILFLSIVVFKRKYYLEINSL